MYRPAIEAHGQWLAVPHSDRHQIAHDIVIGDRPSGIFAASNRHRDLARDLGEPQRRVLGLSSVSIAGAVDHDILPIGLEID